jgi:hypothetical protein
MNFNSGPQRDESAAPAPLPRSTEIPIRGKSDRWPARALTFGAATITIAWVSFLAWVAITLAHML